MSIGNEKDFQTVGNMKIFDKRLGMFGFGRILWRLGWSKNASTARRDTKRPVPKCTFRRLPVGLTRCLRRVLIFYGGLVWDRLVG